MNHGPSFFSLCFVRENATRYKISNYLLWSSRETKHGNSELPRDLIRFECLQKSDISVLTGIPLAFYC